MRLAGKKALITGPHMTATQIHLCERLKQLGFSRQSQIRFYGSQFELVGDPLVISEGVMLVDIVERKSGESCCVRIPLNIVKMRVAYGGSGRIHEVVPPSARWSR